MERENIKIQYPVLDKKDCIANICIEYKHVKGAVKYTIKNVFKENLVVSLCIRNFGCLCYACIDNIYIEIAEDSISVIPLLDFKNKSGDTDLDIDFTDNFDGYVYAIGYKE